MPVETHDDIVPATGVVNPNGVETHEDIKPAMGVEAYAAGGAIDYPTVMTGGEEFAVVPKKSYGGGVPSYIPEERIEDLARRLITFSYAVAPLVPRVKGTYAEGGSVDDAQNAVDIARNLTPMGFYSAAAEAASKIPQRAPIDQIINKLKGSPNVKGEELDWSGVRDAFAGQKSVDPTQVAQHLQANLPQIQETVYGYDPKTKMKTKEKPRYEQYSAPGGGNYREVLLHLPEQGDGDYQSSHWSGRIGSPAVKNILAHLRMTDRGMYGFGDPVALHLEEVQSDWGQEGRDAGFDKRKGLNAEERRELNQLVSVPMRERTNDQMNRFNELINQRDFESISSAPHVTTTEGWTDLALKRALLEAAKGKYKKLTWTPGEEQADRYGLDKSFSEMHYSPDSKELFAKGHEGVDDIHEKVHPEALHSFIGKELASKLLNQPVKENTNRHFLHGDTIQSLSGSGLKMEQKGMRDFYDRMIPSRLQKLVSKLDPEAKVQLYGHKIYVPGEDDPEDGEYKKVHSLEITPKLRAAILKGLPAYADGGPAVSDEGDTFKEYTVGDKTYSSVNPKMDSPNLEKAVTWALDKAARAQSLFDKSVPAQIYKQAVLDRRTEPFTEKDFNQNDLQSLARAIVRSQAEGRNYLKYEDYYPTNHGQYDDGPFPVITGAANYDIDKAGNAVVRDTYDFNNYEKYGSTNKWPRNPAEAATWLGRRALPSGIRGVPVSINIPKESLENALATGAQTPENYDRGGSIIRRAFDVISKLPR